MFLSFLAWRTYAMIRCFRMIFLASLKDAQQSEDYKEYMSFGEGRQALWNKIHRQHVEFLARYPIRKWVGRCEFVDFTFLLLVWTYMYIESHVYNYMPYVICFLHVHEHVHVYWSWWWLLSGGQEIFSKIDSIIQWSGPISSHIPLDNGISTTNLTAERRIPEPSTVWVNFGLHHQLSKSTEYVTYSKMTIQINHLKMYPL